MREEREPYLVTSENLAISSKNNFAGDVDAGIGFQVQVVLYPAVVNINNVTLKKSLFRSMQNSTVTVICVVATLQYQS